MRGLVVGYSTKHGRICIISVLLLLSGILLVGLGLGRVNASNVVLVKVGDWSYPAGLPALRQIESNIDGPGKVRVQCVTPELCALTVDTEASGFDVRFQEMYFDVDGELVYYNDDGYWKNDYASTGSRPSATSGFRTLIRRMSKGESLRIRIQYGRYEETYGVSLAGFDEAWGWLESNIRSQIQ